MVYTVNVQELADRKRMNRVRNWNKVTTCIHIYIHMYSVCMYTQNQRATCRSNFDTFANRLIDLYERLHSEEARCLLTTCKCHPSTRTGSVENAGPDKDAPSSRSALLARQRSLFVYYCDHDYDCYVFISFFYAWLFLLHCIYCKY